MSRLPTCIREDKEMCLWLFVVVEVQWEQSVRTDPRAYDVVSLSDEKG